MSVPGRVNSSCKGPGGRVCLACLRYSKEVSVVGEGERKGEGRRGGQGGEGRAGWSSVRHCENLGLFFLSGMRSHERVLSRGGIRSDTHFNRSPPAGLRGRVGAGRPGSGYCSIVQA